MNVKTIKCPTCGKPVPWVPESRYRPFCSERCRQIDLGAWAADQYTIPVVEDDDLPPDAPGGESGGTSGRLN
ncbi:DNA gyrase inhibitor YacG [Ralstonia syzygii]|uniref:DNA gyrase inhibitor YacG n=1 Tax=Ralstonia syzygii TaxID=28097 RepID=UPI0018D030BF|nr:DNA gyrase inhibitor YacG [Ralstonia syzygii]CAH0443519.1 DNA gyrase inhibitor YacG [Ralstonia syzygii subsp. syzygii]